MPFVIIIDSAILLIVSQIYNLGIAFRLNFVLSSFHPEEVFSCHNGGDSTSNIPAA